MKKGIHPQVYTDAIIICACGNKFNTISTQKEIRVDICSNCHPFFTGQQKFIDIEGRIDKFTKKMQLSETRKAQEKEKKAKKEIVRKTQISPKPTLKELLQKAKQKAE